MAIVTTTGEVIVYYRKVFDGDPALGVRLRHPTGKAFAGPTAVCVSDSLRDLGAWHVPAGGSAFVGRKIAGTLKLTWRRADQPAAEREVKVLDRAITVELAPPGK